MRKNFHRSLFLAAGFVIFFILSGQSVKEDKDPALQLPREFQQKLDSLRKKDDLAEWLYAHREYVYAEPAKRIPVLIRAQSTAWRKPATDAERTEWFNCLTAQGYYLLYGGNILKSIDAYEQAYRFYFDHPLPEEDVLEYVLKPLGNNYTRLGDYDRAFFIQEKSLALAEQKDSVQISSICHNLATTAIWKEDLPLAKQYCRKGLQLVKKGSPLHGLLLSTLSETYLRSGDKDSAEINIMPAIRVLSANLSNKEAVNVPYWLRGAWQGLGDIQKEKTEWINALSSYQKAQALIDKYYKGQRKREKAQLCVSAGQVLQRLQQPAKAMEQYNAALSLLLPGYLPGEADELPDPENLYGETALADALRGKADCLLALNKKERALQCYMRLYTIAGKLRNEYYSAAAKRQQQKENRVWTESAISTAFELWSNSGKKEYADTALLIAEMSKAQLLLDEMMNNMRYDQLRNKDSLMDRQQRMMQAIIYYERENMMNRESGKEDSNVLILRNEMQYELSLVQKQLKEKYPRQEDYMRTALIPSAGSLLQNVPPGTTVIEYFAGDRDIYIIEAEKNRIKQLRKLTGARALLKRVNDFTNTFFQQGPANMMNRPREYYREAGDIYQKLWQGIVPEENIVVIPDGVLGYLPFDALVTDSVYRTNTDQWPFLVKKTNLYSGYSLQTLGQQKKSEHRPGSFTGFFISFDSNRSPIPAVRREYDEIRGIVSGDFLRDDQASLSAFNKHLVNADILHISTHSFLQGSENIPVLQLSDDKFFLFELYGKTFNPQLVVLSACRTGHGMLAQGEGIISLARGFTTTGAAGIVAGLWSMNDETTARLMGIFYRQLVTDHRPANALHSAKLKWLEQKNDQPFQKLPYFWAGMIYSGDNLPVDISPKNTSAGWWWVAAFVAMGILILFLKWKKSPSIKKFE